MASSGSGPLSATDSPRRSEPACLRPSLDAGSDRQQRFEALFRNHVDRVYRFCHVRLRNAQEAEDATSQTFLKALAAWDSYRGGTPSAWLLKIANNACADIERTRRVTLTSELPDVGNPEDVPRGLSLNDVEVVRAALASLPNAQRQALTHFMAGSSLEESAEAMGRSEGAIKMLRRRGLESLRRRLGVTPRKRAKDV